MGIDPHFQFVLDCRLLQWHTIDLVSHAADGMCKLLSVAIEAIFKACGKEIQNTYRSEENEQTVKSAKMRKWLEQIRQESRSK